MSLLTIQAKAHSTFAMLKEQQQEESTETFTARHGWFQRFRSRFNLHNRGISGEVASADIEGVEKFIPRYLFVDQLVHQPGRWNGIGSLNEEYMYMLLNGTGKGSSTGCGLQLRFISKTAV